ncbi:SGNH/GDSL hydrolase family protein [Paenibacillus shunpengii]|uniref:SGNH/GDSL hydrolase family protein n=1 Tax=Paenibacillus shunpengii TaxID=2054424 RepID=A0ABW5SK24_9BACL|nr:MULTISPECIES: SGNH/GDSL hydrolase family protein [unclassified Paenibacillus]OMC71139.1 GDSL family lipase [Paenibacillus sp. FSL H7-0326]SDW17825.1 Lysophospholipase L1 [Paenibacillus sp. PDC88]
MKLAQNDKLVFIGDSVTDCGRTRPVGEGSMGLGNGYVYNVDALLQSVYPELNTRVINVGIGGNNVRDLKNRWQEDVLDLQPDWLSVMIGINDVWRQFDSPQRRELHVFLDEYEATLRELVASVRPQVKGLVLMTPYYLEPSVEDPMRSTMDLYGAAVKRVAEEYDAVFVDTQAAYEPIWKQLYPGAIAWDRVHPNHTGHMVLARAFLNSIGFDWNK